MARSLALALHLLAARRTAAPFRNWSAARGEGPLLWLHICPAAAPRALAQLIDRIGQDRPGLSVLLTFSGETPPDFGPSESLPRPRPGPADAPREVAAFLAHWRPDLAVLVGPDLPVSLIVEAAGRGIPMILAEMRADPDVRRRWRWRSGMAADLLRRFTRILAQDADTAEWLRKVGGGALPVTIAGHLEETADPLPCNEAEREALAELLHARPVWLAMACPPSEEEAVIAAHLHAMQHAHRMLLILVPTESSRGNDLADNLTRSGLIVACRPREEEPDPAVQVFITDGETELGLWYRLAPVTYMGGTLAPGGRGRSPLEPAALGSAILHGPLTDPHTAAFARLTAAGAARRVDTPAGLAAAVADLISPDKAALLAHNAWVASSGGAEVAETMARVILDSLARAEAT